MIKRVQLPGISHASPATVRRHCGYIDREKKVDHLIILPREVVELLILSANLSGIYRYLDQKRFVFSQIMKAFGVCCYRCEPQIESDMVERATRSVEQSFNKQSHPEGTV